MDVHLVESTSETTKAIDFCPSRSLKINSNLSGKEEKKLCQLLKENLDAFSWDYKDMKGVHPLVCRHHIYIKEGFTLVRQPQRRMNPALKDIVKEEMQKLLD